ncbi:B-box zinc finger family protein [Babesia bovis T2Bo]|uniref:PH domain-containing protein n=1 Tax=Babesia bovis TaxID=5865 RepID=A7AWQ1_BABBO|nr:B-box zinc finger family protein [Babesia bovis T2Bo]EDO05479.1 B-box zinc finger family protein [Babesia bovis T2Bo]|eukprot:XP_001609047.1 hypothetical protein [Babesia bovis T2Bo]
MAGDMIGNLISQGIDLGRVIKTDGTDLFSGYADVARSRLPHLADSVVDAFGRVLDIFERPTNLKKPVFDVERLKPSRQIDIEEANRPSDTEVKPVPKQLINENVHIDQLAGATRALYNATQAEADTVTPMYHVVRNVAKSSASPCDAEVRLCSECYISLATVRCNSCVMHFCGVCAVQRHSDGINQTHKLVTATSGKETRLTASDQMSGLFSYGDMATQASGSKAGNMYQDMTIQIRPGESAFPSYEPCTIHEGCNLQFACTVCHMLPVCTRCTEEAHTGDGHKVVEIERAAAEVKELLGDCLNAVVRRHNDLSLVLPELQLVADTSNAGLKNATRSMRSGLQRVHDALKVKRTLGMQDIKNMQQVGSAALNRLMHASGALSRYFRGCLAQLEAINRVKNPGMALNMFVDLRANFEKILFTDEEIPDLVLEVPHWHLHCGNLANLLLDHETRLHLNFTQIAALSSTLRACVRDCVNGLEKIANGTRVMEQPEIQHQPRRLAERRTRPPGPSLWVKGAENTLDIVNHAELKGLFLRRDSQRCSWRQRAVYLCGPRLFVLESDLFADDVPVESSIDLSAITIRPFRDPNTLQITKLQRIGHPNGFEITENKNGSMRFWLFTCESDKTVDLWTVRIERIVAKLQRDREMSNTNQFQAIEAPPLKGMSDGTTLQQLHKLNCESPADSCVMDPEGEHRTCEDTHDPEYFYDDQNFKIVADTLKKVKNESKALYDKCFRNEREIVANQWQVEDLTLHAASLPSSETRSLADDASICTTTMPRLESKSSGRYEMPEEPVRRARSIATRASVFQGNDITLPSVLPKFTSSPSVKSPKSILQLFQNIGNKIRNKKDCDILDRY